MYFCEIITYVKHSILYIYIISMLEFQKKKRIKKILYSPIIVLILAIIFVLLIRGAWGVYKKEKLSSQNLRQDQIELEKIIARQNGLASSLDYLKTEQGVESEIRSKFRAVKEGEKVSVIIDDSKSEATATATTTEKGFWSKMFNWF